MSDVIDVENAGGELFAAAAPSLFAAESAWRGVARGIEQRDERHRERGALREAGEEREQRARRRAAARARGAPWPMRDPCLRKGKVANTSEIASF